MIKITIDNNGAEIKKTNYYETESAAAGMIYCSVNSGAFRVLLPPQWETEIPDMRKSVKYAVITRGTYHGSDALEIMLEDNSDNPYAVHIGVNQCDRLPAAEDNGREDLSLIIYQRGKTAGKPKKVIQRQACYRVENVNLPYMKGWKL